MNVIIHSLKNKRNIEFKKKLKYNYTRGKYNILKYKNPKIDRRDLHKYNDKLNTSINCRPRTNV